MGKGVPVSACAFFAFRLKSMRDKKKTSYRFQKKMLALAGRVVYFGFF